MWITNITFYVDFELYEDGLSLKKNHNKFGKNWTNVRGGV